MELHNAALIQEELLINISKVIEDGWPAGPSFFHALGSLIEAAVIHDKVFYDPLRQTLRNDLSGGIYVPSLLNESDLIQQLIREGVLTLFPESAEIDKHLEETGSSYKYGNFLVDFYYQLVSFSSTTPDGDITEFPLLDELINKAPSVLMTESLIADEGVTADGAYLFLTDAGLKAHLLGFSRQDMIQLEGYNRRVKGYLELTQSIEIDFYPVFRALPYQIGAVKTYSSKAKALYESIVNKAVSLDDEPGGENEFSRVPVPPLSQIVMAKSKGSIKALAGEIIELRYRQRDFRRYLTDYERQWDTATTRAERFKLRNEFDNAWKTFVVDLERPSTRIIYTLWDIFKNPLNILPAIGDKLRAKGHELSVIGKVRGLHDFWEELVNAQVPNRNIELSKMFPRLADEREWQLSRNLANSINSFLNKE